MPFSPLARAPILGVVVVAFLGATPTVADFESKRIDEGLYYVYFERSERMSGGMFDTDKQVRKKLESNTSKLCAREGFKYLRYPTASEVRRDDTLRRAWREATGEEPSASLSMRSASPPSALTRSHHVYRCLALFSKEKKAGFERCR